MRQGDTRGVAAACPKHFDGFGSVLRLGLQALQRCWFGFSRQADIPERGAQVQSGREVRQPRLAHRGGSARVPVMFYSESWERKVWSRRHRLTKSLDRTRADDISCQCQRHWPPASVSSIVSRLGALIVKSLFLLCCFAWFISCAPYPQNASIQRPLTREQRMIRDARAYFVQNQHKFAKTLPKSRIMDAPSKISYHVPPASEPYWIVTVPVEYTCPSWMRCAGRRVTTAVEVFLHNDGTPYLL
jgi:hypothetical protein